MKKHLMKLGLILALSLLLAAPVCASPQNATTGAEVEFVEGLGPTKPVDPDDPGAEIDGTEVDGSLAFVYVSDFTFGSIPISSANRFYEIKTVKPNIQIVDLRGTAAGWRVSASVTEFTDSGGASVLPGAKISFLNGEADSISDSGEPVQHVVSLTTDGQPLPVLGASAGSGAGLWVMRWYPETPGEAYIKLFVPGGAATLGNYSAEINWVMENVPYVPPEPEE